MRKEIAAAAADHAEAVKGAAPNASRKQLLTLNRKAEHAVSLMMQAAGDDAALTEKIIARLSVEGEDGKAGLVLIGDEIDDRKAFIEHHRLAARAIASAAKVRSSRPRA